jgi:transcription termination factor Rho
MKAMAVLERSDLEASPLADLHAIADQLGLDGFRRLRKAELIDAILERATGDGRAHPAQPGQHEAGDREPESGDREPESGDREPESGEREPESGDRERGEGRARRSLVGRGRRRARSASARRATTTTPDGAAAAADASPPADTPAAPVRAAGGEGAGGAAIVEDATIAEGVVELLGNGSGFLRVSPPEASDQDVYISAAQARRCELVSGDRVSGPVRTPRRSERYPSLVRVDTINGEPADSVSGGARFEDLPVAYPSERLALGASDPTLEAIEWLTPLGLGSRAVIVGAARSGKTETLRRILAAIGAREELAVSLVLVGVRPEEIAQWQEGTPAPAGALGLAASADAQGQLVDRAVDAARRAAARGGNALVLIDCLDGLHPSTARKALAAARNILGGGSLTVIATAARPFGGETTVIALDAILTATGRQPILDLANSGTLRPELLVGEDGARAISQARAAALDAAS